MKSRFINGVLQKRSSSSYSRIIVLTGARQTGKTTLAKKLGEKITAMPAAMFLT